jgi:hypothetical protein
VRQTAACVQRSYVGSFGGLARRLSEIAPSSFAASFSSSGELCGATIVAKDSSVVPAFLDDGGGIH